jgi:bifunctional oligoribonuclease and PAP phosphatase NrnA
METIFSLLHDKRRFVLTTHVNPDGDAIGSEVALAAWLTEAGKQVRIINHSPTPAVYKFLDPEGAIRTYDQTRDAVELADAEVIIVVDANQPGRLRSMEPAVLGSRALKICIDHHLEPHGFADYYLIEEDATSTGEILFRLLGRLTEGHFSSTIATALYCAILADTGSFRYPRVDPEIHRIAARLIECGADPVDIYGRVFEQWSDGRIHLLGETLRALHTTADGRIAYVTITRDMLQRTGTSEEDTDNFTTYPMSIAGVLVGILFLELTQGLKISFRSRGNIPINELARQFGGNGHRNAAGARIREGDLGQVREAVLAAALTYLNHEDIHR